MTGASYRALFDLSGKVAVVTGACGILGREFCRGLAEFGAAVAAVDLDAAAAEALAADLAETHGVKAVGIACDVSSADDVRAMVERVESALGGIDVLHNNAGNPPIAAGEYFAPFETFDLDTWRKVLATDLDGMFLVAQAVGARMASRGSGSIVQTASIYGGFGSDQRIYEGHEFNNPAVYSAGKAGVIGLTRWLATYWAGNGIRVNAIAPGGVESGQSETFRRRYAARVPLGRMACREEMVGALIWLASSASSYVTGQVIYVDGGLSAW